MKYRINLDHIIVLSFLATKMKFAMNIQALQKKKQDSKKLASLSNQSEKRATELEQNIVQMKHQQTLLEKRLHEESEKKKQLETEIQRDQRQIKVGLFLLLCNRQ